MIERFSALRGGPEKAENHRAFPDETIFYN